ncbi:ABC transporter substrate-binding protein [Desulfosporosinus sp. FKA]|uniref:ABC transporter substrate-binding protein n=1 Tax=Desulfosporosinus sp. FKA TaxID=1969834 RepID=UPI001FA940BD|nr:ABC transporter substrate-binding protein [Desulfosporosinus sp. FKA]
MISILVNRKRGSSLKRLVKSMVAFGSIVCMLCFSGCGSQTTGSSQQAVNNSMSGTSQTAEKTIVDMSGKSVKIPSKVNRIVVTCYGGASNEVVVLGAADKIVGQPSQENFRQLLKFEPQFKKIPDCGSFDNISVEEIIKLKPDVVVASVTSPKGNKKLEDAGIPVVTVLTGRATIDGLHKEFKMMGEVLDKESDANALLGFWDNGLKLLKDDTAKLPADKKKVYYMLGTPLQTDGTAWGEDLITTVGGVNVSKGLGNANQISVEQLLSWNPDSIIMSSNIGPTKNHFIMADDLRNNPQMSNINAVKNNQLYECPIGAFWWDRPSPESILGMMWLAKSLYPDTFANINLEQETKDFFQKFYHYSLTSEEYNSFLNPQTAANK